MDSLAPQEQAALGMTGDNTSDLAAPLAWRERRHWMRCREARVCSTNSQVSGLKPGIPAVAMDARSACMGGAGEHGRHGTAWAMEGELP